MITENLSTLKIHKLTQDQYDRELAAGRIDENALYLTPYEETDLSEYVTQEYVDEGLATKQPIGDYALKSDIPDISSAITEETDPTVPAWAKEPNKPTYTATEVGALPADTVIPTVPTNVSAFANDAGYLTQHQSLTGYATETYVTEGLATKQPIGDYAFKSDIPSTEGLASTSYVDAKMSNYITVDIQNTNEGEPNPIDANTLNGKHENDLHVAHSANSENLGGYAADEYVRKEEISGLTPSGSVEINYSVVGSLTEPENKIQNMIWIKTNETIGKVFIEDHEPNEIFANGDVWILTGRSSNVAFSSLKIDNSYMNIVNPISANMYMNGEWVSVEVTIWQNGEWCFWWNGQLYENGIEFEHVTGGWITEGKCQYGGSFASPLTITRNADSLSFTQQSSGGGGILRTTEKVSLKGINKLVFDGDIIGTTNNGYAYMYVWSSLETYSDRGAAASIRINDINKQDTTVTLPVGDLNLDYYIGFFLYSPGITVNMKSLTMVE